MKPTPKISAQVAAWLIIVSSVVNLLSLINFGFNIPMEFLHEPEKYWIMANIALVIIIGLLLIGLGIQILNRKKWAHTVAFVLVTLSLLQEIIWPLIFPIRSFDPASLFWGLALLTFLWLSKDEFKKKAKSN